MQAYPATLLFEQMLGEWLVTMESEGMVVEMSLQELTSDTHMIVNVDCLRRVMDNLFDNIRKYADRAYPIQIKAHTQVAEGETRVCLALTNRIGDPLEGSSGTHVGHRICANMASLMGGKFSTHIQGDMYTATICFPVAQAQETELT